MSLEIMSLEGHVILVTNGSRLEGFTLVGSLMSWVRMFFFLARRETFRKKGRTRGGSSFHDTKTSETRAKGHKGFILVTESLTAASSPGDSMYSTAALREHQQGLGAVNLPQIPWDGVKYSFRNYIKEPTLCFLQGPFWHQLSPVMG